MRPGVFLASLSAFLFLACSSEPVPLDQAQKEALRAEVQETLAGLTDAMNGHDPEEVFGYFRKSEEFLYLGCTDFLSGWGTFSQRVGPYYATTPAVVFQQEVIRIQVLSPTVAVAALRGSSTEAEALFWTEVLVKEDGRWVIVHEHESWPGCSPPSAAHPFTTPSEMPGMAGMDSIAREGGMEGS